MLVCMMRSINMQKTTLRGGERQIKGYRVGVYNTVSQLIMSGSVGCSKQGVPSSSGPKHTHTKTSFTKKKIQTNKHTHTQIAHGYDSDQVLTLRDYPSRLPGGLASFCAHEQKCYICTMYI